MTISKGIHVFARYYTNNADLVDYHVCGSDRVATLEVAIAKLPEKLRADTRKQLGRVLEAKDGFEIISSNAFDKDTKSAAFVSVRSTDMVTK